MAKETEGYSIDYNFIGKYIRDSSDVDKDNQETNAKFSSISFQEKKGEIEVFSSVGEEESNSKNFHEKHQKEDEIIPDNNEKIESNSYLTEAKKEFIKHLEDDSLTIDACERLNHDWNKE